MYIIIFKLCKYSHITHIAPVRPQPPMPANSLKMMYCCILTDIAQAINDMISIRKYIQQRGLRPYLSGSGDRIRPETK